jgi:predicted P-loop ATPase
MDTIPTGLGCTAEIAASPDVVSPAATPNANAITVREAVGLYRERGWCPVPIAGKVPTGGEGWAHRDYDDAAFVSNIGIILGARSNGLVDVDLDCAEAVWLAHLILPSTNATFGRKGKPQGHWLYVVNPPPENTSQFQTGADGMLVELRSTGVQTMFPPSVHPDSRERVEWVRFGEPARVDGRELLRDVGTLAGMALLVRYWPAESGRFNAEGAFVGALLRAGRDEADVERLVGAMRELGGTAPRVYSPGKTVARLRKRLAEGKKVPGLTKLRECVGAEVVDCAARWMGLLPHYVRSEVKKNGETVDLIIANHIGNMRRALTDIGVELSYDQFADKITVDVPGKTHIVVGNNEMLEIWFRVQEVCGFRPTKDFFFDFLIHEALRSQYHPVLDYLSTLTWDGVERVDGWLETHFGVIAAGDDDVERERDRNYIRAVGRNFLIGMVARVKQPGCKLDDAPVFVGPEAMFKSTGLKALAHPWFTDSVPDVSSKEAPIQLLGIWLAEMSELTGTTASRIEIVKAFMSRSTDRYRPVYGKLSEDRPRQGVFALTTNRDDFLDTSTGARRFRPLRVTKLVDVKAIERDRDQLFAEALHLYESGAKWWMEEADVVETAATVADRHRHQEPWEEAIARVLQDCDLTSVADLLSAIGVGIERQDAGAARRAAKVLRSMSWKVERVKSGVLRDAQLWYSPRVQTEAARLGERLDKTHKTMGLKGAPRRDPEIPF